MLLSQSTSTAARPFIATQRATRVLPVPSRQQVHSNPCIRRVLAHAQDEDSQTTTTSSQPAASDEEMPVWVRREKERELQAAGKQDLPWPLYLVLSVLVAIASVGSVFEYLDKNPVFGVIPPDSPLWAPILGLFAFTGLPTAGFLFFKGVNAANEAAEKQDKLDGYIK